MKYEIRFKYRERLGKSFRSGMSRFSKLEELHDFVLRIKNKYVDTYFEKYVDGELISSFN